MSLADQRCEPCHGGTPVLTREQFAPLLAELSGWTVDADRLLRKSIKTKNFVQSLALANRIGEIAEEQGHHPDLLVRWGELQIEVWTHAVNGLTQADFVLAARIDRSID